MHNRLKKEINNLKRFWFRKNISCWIFLFVWIGTSHTEAGLFFLSPPPWSLYLESLKYSILIVFPPASSRLEVNKSLLTRRTYWFTANKPPIPEPWNDKLGRWKLSRNLTLTHQSASLSRWNDIRKLSLNLLKSIAPTTVVIEAMTLAIFQLLRKLSFSSKDFIHKSKTNYKLRRM